MDQQVPSDTSTRSQSSTTPVRPRHLPDLRRPKLTLSSWALFDFANSVLITNGGLYFSQWLVVDHGVAEIWYNFALSLTSFVVLLTAPIIGKIGDRNNNWWHFLWATGVIMFICP